MSGKEEDFTAEEMDKCIASPRYFYNKYWKIYDKNGNEIPKKELTEEEWNERTTLIEKMRNTPIQRSLRFSKKCLVTKQKTNFGQWQNR